MKFYSLVAIAMLLANTNAINMQQMTQINEEKLDEEKKAEVAKEAAEISAKA